MPSNGNVYELPAMNVIMSASSLNQQASSEKDQIGKRARWNALKKAVRKSSSISQRS